MHYCENCRIIFYFYVCTINFDLQEEEKDDKSPGSVEKTKKKRRRRRKRKNQRKTKFDNEEVKEEVDMDAKKRNNGMAEKEVKISHN